MGPWADACRRARDLAAGCSERGVSWESRFLGPLPVIAIGTRCGNVPSHALVTFRIRTDLFNAEVASVVAYSFLARITFHAAARRKGKSNRWQCDNMRSINAHLQAGDLEGCFCNVDA